MTANHSPSTRRARRKSVAMFIIIAAILIGCGSWYYRVEAGRVTGEKYEALKTVGQLKANQIQIWRQNRQADLLEVANAPFFRESLESFLNLPEDEQLRAVMADYLNLERGPGEGALLYAPDGRFLLGEGDDASMQAQSAAAPLQAAITTAIARREVVISDLYRCEHGDVHLDAVMVVADAADQPLAVVVLRLDAASYLYPLIESWPTPSRTSETLLVQRAGDEVVYLNRLRHQTGEPLSLRASLADRGRPEVRAVLGETGIFEGRDYRGVEVVSDLQQIAESPWFIVTKMDVDEVVSAVRYRTGFISIITVLLVLMSAGFATLSYRRQQTRIAQQLIESEDRNVEDQHRHELILHTAMDGFSRVDVEGHILEVNEAYCRMTGYCAAELLTMRVADLEANETRVQTVGHMQTIMERGEDRFESRQRRKDGSIVAVEVSVQYRPADGECVAFIRDITARKDAEARIKRLTMLYAGLSRCDKAIVHAADAEALLTQVCRDVVEHGGMKMAWIGLADQAGKRVFPTVFHGSGTEYLAGLEISLDAASVHGRGPTGTAIREGRPIFCQDFQHDPSTAPWHDRGAQAGWQSSASIPLCRSGKTIGAFTLYSADRHAFDEEVQTLLVEMAANISFALDSFAHEKERRKALEELQNLRTAVEQSADTIVITDPSGKIEYANPAFEKSTGYRVAEVLGKNPRVLYSGEHDQAFYQDLWATITVGQTWKGQFHNRRKDGVLYWESATISPVRNDQGEIVHFIGVKDDITAMKAIELRLREALDRAESANRTKGEFLAVMSHELRTPLNGVLGFAELLAQTPLNAEQLEYAQTIKSSGDHLLQIVNDILDFSSIEKGSMALDAAPVAIAELLETACLGSRKTAADKGLTFRCEIAPEVPRQLVGDTRRIRQILINLLGNAVKFTARGAVTLRVAPALEAGRQMLEFAVEDTGPGIRAEMIERLFQPFTQGDSTLHRQFEGTGLGLAISQRLAGAMDGQIMVVSTPGKGSTFTLRLPVGSPVASDQELQSSVPVAEPSVKPLLPERPVLVVEDDPVNRMLVGIMLKRLGYRVETVTDGREALEVFVPGKYFALLMDMQMPEMDGLEATRMIREREVATQTRVPIIALTANVMPGDRERCLAAGMDDFLTKPFKKSDVAAKLTGFPLDPPPPSTGL